MKEHLTQYLEMEYRAAQRDLVNSSDKYATVQNALQRCLGAAQIVQGLGITYEEAATLFEAYTNKLNELLDR